MQNKMETLAIEVVSSSTQHLPPSALVSVTLDDISQADAQAISIASLRLRCAGIFPVRLQLNYDEQVVDHSHTYALSVKIRQAGMLNFITTQAHVVDLAAAEGTIKVTVDAVLE